MKKAFILFAVTIILTACSARQLTQGAENVRVLPSQPASGCKYLGEIVGSQGNRLTGGVTSNKNLAQGSLNDLKNKAYKLGGNAIYLMDSKTASTGGSYYGTGSQVQTSQTMMGIAYYCANF